MGLFQQPVKECIERIAEYTAQGKDPFMHTSLIQDGVIRNVEIIGEAAKQISPQLKFEHPDIPWRRIAGFRDVLIHDYMGVDLGEVWGIIESSLPALKNQIDILLRC